MYIKHKKMKKNTRKQGKLRNSTQINTNVEKFVNYRKRQKKK